MKVLFPSTGCCSGVITQPPGHKLEQVFVDIRTPLKSPPTSPAISNVDKLITVSKEQTGITVPLIQQFLANTHDAKGHRPAHYPKSCPQKKV